MEPVYVMILESEYDKPTADGYTEWAMVDMVFETLEDCQKYIDKEFDENDGLKEVSEGCYMYQFILDRPLVVYRDNDEKEILGNKGSKLTIRVYKVEFIRKEKV